MKRILQQPHHCISLDEMDTLETDFRALLQTCRACCHAHISVTPKCLSAAAGHLSSGFRWSPLAVKKNMVYEESACGSHRLKCSSLAAIFTLEKELKSLYMVQFDLLKTCRISVWIRPAGHGWAHHHWPQWVSNFASLDQVSLASGLDTESPARTMDMTNAFTCGVQDKTCIKCASGGYNYSEWVYKATYNWGVFPCGGKLWQTPAKLFSYVHSLSCRRRSWA